MSKTKQDNVLVRDIRYTPAWCTQALLDRMPPPTPTVFDPCAGDGSILRTVKENNYRVAANEIRGEQRQSLEEITDLVTINDWLDAYENFDLASIAIVTNPPYSVGPDIMEACLKTQTPYCAALLRLNHLGSSTWTRQLWKQYPPTNLVILGSKRPSFSNDGRTDASEYAWVIWDRKASTAWFDIV